MMATPLHSVIVFFCGRTEMEHVDRSGELQSSKLSISNKSIVLETQDL